MGGDVIGKRLESSEINVCADVGMCLNRGDGGGYGVQIHYVGARFSAADKNRNRVIAPEQGRMIGAVLSPHHGQVPAEDSFTARAIRSTRISPGGPGVAGSIFDRRAFRLREPVGRSGTRIWRNLDERQTGGRTEAGD